MTLVALTMKDVILIGDVDDDEIGYVIDPRDDPAPYIRVYRVDNDPSNDDITLLDAFGNNVIVLTKCDIWVKPSEIIILQEIDYEPTSTEE